MTGVVDNERSRSSFSDGSRSASSNGSEGMHHDQRHADSEASGGEESRRMTPEQQSSKPVPDQSGRGDYTMQIIDFLDDYVQSCVSKNTHIIPSVRQNLKEAIDGGPVPRRFDISGRNKEMKGSLITDDYVPHLIVPMMSVTFLLEIDLSYNEIGDSGAATIADYLRDDRHLRTFRLNCNNIGTEGCIALSQALMVNETLSTFDISYNPLMTEGGMHMASMLQVNNGLTRLYIAGCTLEASALIALSTVLQNNQFLEVLDISDNVSPRNRLSQSMENDIMMHISKMIRINDTLNELYLSKMGISDWTMCNLLSSAIRSNTTLKTLDLSCNRITRDGGVALCQALCENNSIRVLKLSCCSLQDEGADAVAVMLLHNKSLASLYLDHNSITGRGICSLASAIVRNRTLSHITLWGNIWDVAACEAFSKLIGGIVRELKINSGLPTARTSVRHSNLENRMSAMGDTLKPIENEDGAGNSHRGGSVVSRIMGRLRPSNVDVVFYSVEGGLQVARNAN
ncbi:hypothetical protein HDV05_002161 [Chytridiales sp. JEL 0842]|nr:hypothetical protein HDV05_002161 [Chytridiales sp. JEL 0842]